LCAGEKDKKDGGDNLYCEIIEEANGIQLIENLQHHENNEIYEKSLRIIENYFDGEQSEDEMKNDEIKSNFEFDNSEIDNFEFK
jgi:importin subunit alpha-1